MLVAEKEHEGDWIVKFVHLLEVWDLVEIAHVDDSKVLDSISDTYAQGLAQIAGQIRICYLR